MCTRADAGFLKGHLRLSDRETARNVHNPSSSERLSNRWRTHEAEVMSR